MVKIGGTIDLKICRSLKKKRRCMGTKGLLALGLWLLLIYKGDASDRQVVNRTITLFFWKSQTTTFTYLIALLLLFFCFFFLLIKERIAKSHGSQCGFCTPGIVMSMYTLLRNNPAPTQKEIESAFEGMKLLS